MKRGNLFVVAGAVFCARLLYAVATVSVGEIKLPTCPFSDPDPVPCTSEGRYPYFRYDGLTAVQTTQTWKTVVLENDRVKVTLLPEIGGRVWGAVDKATAREFISFNHVVKFRNLAIRGPWCSGGIEFNFGSGAHAPTTATPVDWCVRTNTDGSASCFVGTTEWIGRTSWQVEVVLPADADKFLTRTTWFNASNLLQPYCQSTEVDGQDVVSRSGRAFLQAKERSCRTPFRHPSFAPGATDAFEEEWQWRDVTRFASPSNAASRSLEMSVDFDWTTSYGLYLRGELALRERDERTGEACLRDCLKREPCFSPALVALAGVSMRRGDYLQVHELCARALAINAYDAGANYLDGFAAFAEGRGGESEERLELAAFSPLYRSSAFVLMAKLALRQGDWARALDLAKKATQANSFNFDAWLIRAASARHAGNLRAARKVIELAQQVVPLHQGIRFEAQLLGDLPATEFLDGVRNELPDQTFMELASWYEEAGLFAEAKELFELARGLLARIRLAYVCHQSREDVRAAEILTAAADERTDFQFPFRRETRRALDWAISQHPSWKFRYLKAVLLASYGTEQESDNLLAACDGADEAIPFLYRAARKRGLARRHDLERAAERSDDWRVGRALVEAYLEDHSFTLALSVSRKFLDRYPANSQLQLLYVRALLALKHFDAATLYLEGGRILPFTGDGEVQALWRKAWEGVARQALSEGDFARADEALRRRAAYPANLAGGSSRPPERD